MERATVPVADSGVPRDSRSTNTSAPRKSASRGSQRDGANCGQDARAPQIKDALEKTRAVVDAVRVGYGMKANEDILAFLLKLNLELDAALVVKHASTFTSTSGASQFAAMPLQSGGNGRTATISTASGGRI